MTNDQIPQGDPAGRAITRFWIAAVVIVLVVGGLVAIFVDWTPTATLFRQARRALEIGDHQAAERLGRRLMLRPARQAEGTLIAAEACEQLGNFNAALDLLNQIPRSDAQLFVIGRIVAARILCDQLHRLADAERPLREALEVDSQSMEAHERLTF